jgi:pyruvate dehydrogenase E1 component
MSEERSRPESPDSDPQETAEWLDSLEYVLESKGPDRAMYLFERLRDRLGARGAQVSAPLNTP